MNPIVEAAWITIGGGGFAAVVGVSGAVIGARIALHSARQTTDTTIRAASQDVRAQIEASSADIRAQLGAASADRRDQIEADRRQRMWEKQAEAYTDAIAGIRHRQKVRQGMWQGMVTGTEPGRPPAPVDWPTLEARLLVYSSPAVITALNEAGDAGQRYESEVGMWQAHGEQARTLASDPISARMMSGQQLADSREAAEKALRDANDLDDRLMDIIRAELHASASQVPAPPVPLGRLSQPGGQPAEPPSGC